MTVSLRSISSSAECLGVSVFTVRRLIAGGDIKAVNIGARLMIPDSELDRVVSQGVGRRRHKKPKKPTKR
jgi:excisionase family DNA binding protein